MFEFEFHQISGLQPSLFVNRLGLPIKTITLLCAKIRLKENGCWLWTAAKRKGYGAVRIRALSAQVLQAHRVCYELVHGPLGSELDLHHKVEDGCIGPSCVNPSHLMPVTKAQHVTDFNPKSFAYIAAHRNHCEAGHPYTEESTRVLRTGIRQCRVCDQSRAQGKRDDERVRPKYAKDPAKLKTHCFRGHPLSGENVRIVKSPCGPQKRCIACEKVREQGYVKDELTHQPTKDSCKNGHPMLGDNIFWRNNGFAGCKACRLQRVKEHQLRNREKVLEAKRRYYADNKAYNEEFLATQIRAIYEDPTLDDDALIEALRTVLK